MSAVAAVVRAFNEPIAIARDSNERAARRGAALLFLYFNLHNGTFDVP